MKVEMIIQPNIIQDILDILKRTGTLHKTTASAMGVTVSGAFPHTDKIKILTICDEIQKEKIMSYVLQVIQRHKGVYSLHCY